MANPDPRIERYENVTDLRQFDRQYKVVNDGTNSGERIEEIWEMCIPGRRGMSDQIYPCGFNGDLAVCTSSAKIASKLRSLLADHRRPGLGNQGGEWSSESAIRFPASLIHEVATIIGARKSRKGRCNLSPEQVAANTARLRAMHAAKRAAKAQGSPNSKPAEAMLRATS